MHFILLEATVILNRINRRISFVLVEVTTLAGQRALFGFDLWMHMLLLELLWGLVSIRIFFRPTLRIRLYLCSYQVHVNKIADWITDQFTGE